MRGGLRILGAARLQKILPLLLLLATWERFGAAPGALPRLESLWAVVFVLAVGALGMHLNVLTDAELDRAKKPELFAALAHSPGTFRVTLAIELALSLVSWLAAFLRSPRLGFVLLASGVASVLYSFNFLTFWAPKRHRLKVTAWGNALTILGGYFGLRLAGLLAARGDRSLDDAWVALAFGTAITEYGLFLAECAVDAEEERSHGLRTLPALAGRATTARVGLGLGLVGAALAGLSLASLPSGLAARPAVVSALLIQLSASVAVVRLAHERDPVPVLRFVDAGFWLSRIVALIFALFGG